MNRSNIFPMVVTGIFVVLLILGFLGFSDKLPLPKKSGDVNYGGVTVWGTIPKDSMDKLIGDTLNKDQHVVIKYTQKGLSTLNSDFIEALASGDGPDVILFSQDTVLKTLDKISLIPYSVMTERSFRDTFLQEGEMFLRPDGIAALPLTIDPIVMFWNKDIFTNALVVTPPALWTEFYNLVPKITVRSADGNITRSLVSFGEYRNISHAKEIVSLLIMQSGSPIVFNQSSGLAPALVIAGASGAENPVVGALRFYTEFSKPGKDAYSWNRSLPYSRTMFESGDLALYFGYASEYRSIRAKNPHLNFDVTVVPQAGVVSAGKQTPNRLTFGQMQGAAIVKASKNPQGALYAAQLLSGQGSIASLSTALGLPPVRNDLIRNRPTDAVQSVFYDSAILSRGWVDPSPSETDALFMTMLDDITSGRTMISDALSVAQNGLGKLLDVYRQ